MTRWIDFMPMAMGTIRATDYNYQNKTLGFVVPPLILEEALAREFAGMSLAEYDALPGTSDWIDQDNPTYSKCDIIAMYRCAKMMESIRQDMSMPKRTKR